MRYPAKNKQEQLMGRRCTFNKEYIRSYKRKKIVLNKELGGDDELVPVKWEICKGWKEETGFIVGFGFCFNGTLHKNGIDQGLKYFVATKRVNYVRVRKTVSSRELKIPASCIKLL